MKWTWKNKRPWAWAAGLAALLLPACSLDQMASGSKISPFEPSPLLPGGRSAMLPPVGSVARGHAREDDLLYRGEIGGRVANVFPFSITAADLERGRERFDMACSPCHGRTGLGHGMIVARGFTPPPSYLDKRVAAAPVGHYYQVMSFGFGAMASYAEQVGVEDRWRIAAYIRAIQLSHAGTLSDVPPDALRGVIK